MASLRCESCYVSALTIRIGTMFRLTAFLLAGLYLALLIGGADRGQQRFGLRDVPVPTVAPKPVAVVETVAAEPEPAVKTGVESVVEPASVAAVAALPQGVGAMPLVDPAAFQPDAASEVFSLANAQEGLMVLVPDEAAAAALSASTGASDEAAATDADEPVWAVVMAEAVNVRSGPTTADGVAGRLVRGDEVMLVGPEQDGWVQVRVEGDGIDGFVAARFLSTLSGTGALAD